MILCVEFQQVHYTDLSEIVQFVKADIIVISVNLKLSSEPFLLSVTFWVLKVSREWSLNLGFGIQKKCPFPLNRGVPSIEVTDTKIN